MEVAVGLEPTKIGFAGRRLDHFGIVRVPLFGFRQHGDEARSLFGVKDLANLFLGTFV